LEKVETVLKRTGLTYEIIPVDDGSSDGTSEILRDWASNKDDNIRRPVILEKNVGKGGV
jgi:glycosyltransferase involved in cell wall biosynthesis